MTHSMIAEQPIALDTRGLDSAFPFIIAIDSTDTIVHLGPTLARVQRGPVVGQKAWEALRFQRRKDDVTFESLCADAPGFAVMAVGRSGMLLRGQLLVSSGFVLFLATPWVASLDELAGFGLSLYDFPPHDPLVDLLVLLQTKSIALDESALMTQRLDAIRARLEKALSDAERNRARLEAMVAAVPWGVLVEDEDGRVALTNPAFCDLFGIHGGPRSMEGMVCADLASVAAQAFVDPVSFRETTLQRLSESMPHLSEQLELRDGRVFERDHVPIGGPAAPMHAHLWHYRDVTAARAAEKELARIRRQAELATVAKNEFLAMMSHEIRTPLSAIVGLANLLNSDLSESLRRDFLRRLDSNARSLLHLVETNLDLARIEADDLMLAPRPFDPWTIADEVTSSLGANAIDKGLDIFVVPADPHVPDVVGDVHRVRQVLLNLVGNAIKFTQRGHIRIGLALESGDAGVPHLVYTVSDTGPGIPLHQHERIFERYVRGEDDAGRGRGVGLGLAICKRLMAAMGGNITVRSAPGEGAEFTVSIPVTVSDAHDRSGRPLSGLHVLLPATGGPLPAALRAIAVSLGGVVVDHPGQIPAGARCVAFALDVDAARMPELARCERVFVVTTDPRGGDDVLLLPITRTSVLQRLERQPLLGRRAPPEMPREGLRVLLVDDDDDGRDVLSHLLSRLGHRVVSVADGHEALAVLTERVPDIILTDLRMPTMSGVELIRHIRAREAASGAERVPIAALSADALSSRRDEALAAGADRFVAKPVGAIEVGALIDALVDRRPRVLIVDDAPDMRLLLRYLLQPDVRWRLSEAADLATAQQAIVSRRFDLVLTDLGLPDGDGAAVVRAVRSAGGRRPPAVVVLSGRDDESLRAACISAGAARVLRKPVDVAVLRSTLEELLP